MSSNTGSPVDVITSRSAVFSGATAAVGVANLLYHPLVSRDLAVSDYGSLGALLGLLGVVGVPAAILQIVIARDVVERQRAVKAPVDLGPLLRRTFLVAVAVALLSALFAPLVGRLLDIPTSTSLLLAAYAFPIVIQIVPIAFLLSEGASVLAGLALLIGAAVRLASVDGLTHARGLDGAMISNLLGAGSAVVAAFVFTLFVRGRRSSDIQPDVHYADAAVSIFGLTGFWALHATPVILARIFLPEDEAGYFAAAAIIAQVGLFVPSLVAILVLPSLAAQRGKGPVARALLIRALAIVGVSSFAIALLLNIFNSSIASLIFSEKFSPAASLVGLLGFVSAVASLVYVVVFFFLSGRSRVSGVVPWTFVVLTVVAVAVSHESGTTIALVSLVAIVLAFLVMTVLGITKGRPPIAAMKMQANELWVEHSIDLTMVVPFYNPGPGVVANIANLVTALDSAAISYEIICVSDGSTDDSAEALERLGHPNVRVVRLPRNAGKGQALRVGMAMGHGHYLGFIDADGDISPSLLQNYVVLMRAYEPDIIFGSKRHPLSQVQYPLLRRVYSWGYQQLIRGLFQLNVRDTQVGLKLVRRDVIAAALPRMLEKRFAFDLELFVVADHVGYNRVFEAPISINHGFTSTVSWRSVVGMMLDTAAIFYRLHLLHFYDEPQPLDVDGEPVETRSNPDLKELS